MKLAADNLNALNPMIARAIRDLDPAPIRELVRRCAKPGVQYMDIIDGILPLAVQYGTPLVVLLMDERSRVPVSTDERLACAVELRQKATEAGLDPSRLIFDPVLPNLRWPDAGRHLQEVVKTVRLLSGWSVFPEPAHTMVGLSNLRSGLRKMYPIEIELRYLAVLAGAGLEMVLSDVMQPGFMDGYRFLPEFFPAGDDR